jgi:hypothetical protein
VPEPNKTVGAKLKWSNENLKYAWLEVEVELALARRTNPKATVLACMKKKCENLKDDPLRVLYDLSGDEHLEITNYRTAVRLHSEGKKLLKTNPKVAAAWQELRYFIVASETSKNKRN